MSIPLHSYARYMVSGGAFARAAGVTADSLLTPGALDTISDVNNNLQGGTRERRAGPAAQDRAATTSRPVEMPLYKSQGEGKRAALVARSPDRRLPPGVRELAFRPILAQSASFGEDLCTLTCMPYRLVWVWACSRIRTDLHTHGRRQLSWCQQRSRLEQDITRLKEGIIGGASQDDIGPVILNTEFFHEHRYKIIATRLCGDAAAPQAHSIR